MADGFPGVFPGGLTTGELWIGAVQPGSVTEAFPGVFPGGLTTGYLTIGAVQSGSAVQTDIAGSFTMSLAFSGDLSALGEMTGTTNFTLAFAGDLTGFGGMAATTTFTLTFSGAMAGLGFLSATTTFSIAFAANLTGQGFVTSTFPITLTFDGSLGSNELNGGFTITLTFTGDMIQPVPPPEPVVDPCERYQCDGEIESVGSAIVSAGYKLATQPAEELPDRAAPRIANNSVRLTPTMVGSCRRVRKS